MSTHDINGRPTDPDTHTRPVREHVARIFPDSAAAPHHAADTDDETLKARAGRNIREAMRPEGEDAALDAPPPARPDDHGQGATKVPLGFFDDVPFMYEFTDSNGPMRCHPASGVGPLTLHVKRPHVATLPNGRTVDLPAGTVLREGMTWEGPPADPLRDLCAAFKANPDPATAAMILKLREQVDRGASPLLAQARDLLHRTVGPLFETGSEDVRAAIVAFLAGEITPDRTDERAHALAAFRTYLDEQGLGEYDREKAEAIFLQGLP